MSFFHFKMFYKGHCASASHSSCLRCHIASLASCHFRVASLIPIHTLTWLSVHFLCEILVACVIRAKAAC